MKSNRKTARLVVSAVCVLIVAVCLMVRSVNRSDSYNDAVESLRAGDYATALEIFERLGNFRNSRQLTNYALALKSYDSGDLSAHIVARTYISRISEGYSGELSEQIRALRFSQ